MYSVIYFDMLLEALYHNPLLYAPWISAIKYDTLKLARNCGSDSSAMLHICLDEYNSFAVSQHTYVALHGSKV